MTAEGSGLRRESPLSTRGTASEPRQGVGFSQIPRQNFDSHSGPEPFGFHDAAIPLMFPVPFRARCVCTAPNENRPLAF